MLTKIFAIIALGGATQLYAHVLLLGHCPTEARTIAFSEGALPDIARLSLDDIDGKVQAVRLNGTEVGPEKGAFNAGVFRIALTSGKKVAAKFALPSFLPPHDYDQYPPLEDSPDFVEYLHIHKVLGAMLLAPQLHGFLMDSDAMKLGGRIRESGVRIGPGPYTVLVMNEIANPWIVKTMENPFSTIPAPDFVQRISEEVLEQLVERVGRIRQRLDALHILANDLHLFIFLDESGRLNVQLADLDAYRWLPKQKVQNNFDAEIALLRRTWKLANEKR